MYAYKSTSTVNMVTKTVKEIIIMLLVCLITMLVLAIVLYQYIPSKKVVPDVAHYTASETVKDLLEDDIDERDKSDKVILTYEVTSSDLRNYQTTKDYVPGKSNPFASYTETTTEEEANGKSTNKAGQTTGGTNTKTKSATNTATDSSTQDSVNNDSRLYTE